MHLGGQEVQACARVVGHGLLCASERPGWLGGSTYFIHLFLVEVFLVFELTLEVFLLFCESCLVLLGLAFEFKLQLCGLLAGLSLLN